MKTKILLCMLLITGYSTLCSQTIIHPWSVLDRGGGKVTAGNVTLQFSLGQTAIQVGTSGGIIVEEGYLPGIRMLNGSDSVMQFSMDARWNMISVPLTVADYSKSVLYPTSTSDAFSFNGGYTTQATLENGKGYWLKFGVSQDVGMVGSPNLLDTIDVVEGWNLIGSIGTTLAVGSITSIPGGMVTTNFFGYHSGYFVSGGVEPGKAYWVKVDQAGLLILSATSFASKSNCIRIVPTNELPPPPPGGAVDEEENFIPKEFALSQNFPNPFNPFTVIRYSLPVPSHVTLKVYDVVGREVAVLIDGLEPAGFRSVIWDAAGLASGIYTYRLNAGTYTEVKKMLFMK